jgi:hypothetical protein
MRRLIAPQKQDAVDDPIMRALGDCFVDPPAPR